MRLWSMPKRAKGRHGPQSAYLRRASRSRYLADPERRANDEAIFSALKTGVIGSWNDVLIVESWEVYRHEQRV